MKAQIARKSGTTCVNWGRSLLLSHCNFSLLNGSAVVSRDCHSNNTKYYPPFFHVSVYLSYSWRSNAVRLSSACYNPVRLQIRLLYTVFVAIIENVSSCCHRLLKTTLVVEKSVVGPYLKSWGLGECYKFRKPIVFCWRFGRKRPRYIWKYSSSSNDFQEWLRLTT